MENLNITGTIFNIQKFSIHDGYGIRTLVFMKGCPLKCLWCSNPESQRHQPEIMFVRKNCIGCGKCVTLCPQGCTNAEDFSIDRKACTLCGICVKYCYANAKKTVGKEMSVYDVLEEIEKDWVFYHNSQGGLTVGGGEPTAQPKFVATLLNQCKKLALHTAIETCGFGDWERISPVLCAPDQIFFDLKHMDSIMHKKLTGVDNTSILENAERVAKKGKDITFRLPLIPGCSDSKENITQTGKFVAGLTGENPQIKIELLPYHALGADKYKWMDIPYSLEELQAPDSRTVEHYNKLLESLGCNVVR